MSPLVAIILGIVEVALIFLFVLMQNLTDEENRKYN
jgi:hypothetical protein